MKRIALIGILALLTGATVSRAEVKVVSARNDSEHATPAFKFTGVPSPATNNAATEAKFTIVDGARDDNGGEVAALHDGKLPKEQDEPTANFFFDAGTPGGRLRVDLGAVTDVKQVDTYSWHTDTRAPQVFNLYGSDGKGDSFNPAPKRGTDPEKCGWTKIAAVDTRPKTGDGGGQYGVSISDSDGALGHYRYLLFDMMRTESSDDFGNTFYSEINVIGSGETDTHAEASPDAAYVIQTADGKCSISIDTSGAPDLADWATNKLAPVLAEWYPKIVAMLPSDGYEPPTHFSVNIRPGDGVAATGGTRVTANSSWLKREIGREAIGSLLHEEVHVIQQYGRARRENPAAHRSPGWLVEGIPDYIRWFLYEPQSHGADNVWLRSHRARKLSYDGSYRITANFLNWAVNNYDKDLIRQLNAAMRQGKYTDDLWTNFTGKTVQDVGAEWKQAVEKDIGSTSAAATEAGPNTLTAEEKAAGWQLLFDGKDFDGWHNFKKEGVQPGWQVKDGELVCVDPKQAGDIVTTGKYDWFELQLDYNISEAGNSGIMYHVTDEGGAVWATGPEFQLEDNKEAHDPIRCGWLYALYTPPIDEKTGKPLDATKPVGEWNHVRLLLTPEKCVHEINGVKYFEYVLGSDDFKQRVSRSKFARMPHFAKSDSGYIALQGDHGQVAFRNIKIRPIAESKS